MDADTSLFVLAFPNATTYVDCLRRALAHSTHMVRCLLLLLRPKLPPSLLVQDPCRPIQQAYAVATGSSLRVPICVALRWPSLLAHGHSDQLHPIAGELARP